MKPDWYSDLRTTSEIIAHLGVPKDIVHIWISDESILAPKIERLWKYHARRLGSPRWCGYIHARVRARASVMTEATLEVLASMRSMTEGVAW